MEKQLRKAFNENFTPVKYQEFLADLDSKFPGHLAFRVDETPVFIPKAFTKKMLDACEAIVDIIVDPSFKKLTERAIPEGEVVPNENAHTHFIAFDFGICENAIGDLEPQLIEMQGFPTLFGFQAYYPEVLKKHFEIPLNYDHFLNGFTRDSYIKLLKEIILGNHEAENVILLEIKPETQKTRIDFYCTREYVGIKPVCLTELIQEDRKLFYYNDGKKTEVKRIYNRVIFNELAQQKANLGPIVDLTQEFDVEWLPHPNWFYRISKYTLPFINHPYVPETFFLNEVKQLPGDLENFVLKPLFSFAGQGVLIDVTKEDIDKIDDPQNWILQRKVKYADIIETPDVPAKAEIRIFYFWKDGDLRPQAVTNLARLSKGKMIGVRYNADKEWVGGNVAFFEK
ncbi:MAG: hypothetical protein ABIQ56_02585 [Chitinophagaceae bacterium]